MELVIVTKQTHTVLLDEAVRLEKKIFPKHESMAETLAAEALKTQNTLILALTMDSSAVSGYVLCRRSALGVGHIDKVAVAPQHRRKGVGRQLINKALTHLQTSRATSASLVVDVERTGAIALYEAAGFHTLTTRLNYYQPGRHALVMQRDLVDTRARVTGAEKGGAPL